MKEYLITERGLKELKTSPKIKYLDESYTIQEVEDTVYSYLTPCMCVENTQEFKKDTMYLIYALNHKKSDKGYLELAEVDAREINNIFNTTHYLLAPSKISMYLYQKYPKLREIIENKYKNKKGGKNNG